MGTKRNPGKHDCYEAADPDEPMFILLARDPLASDLVDEWAKRREQSGRGGEKAEEARRCASAMREWYFKMGDKAPPKKAGPRFGVKPPPHLDDDEAGFEYAATPPAVHAFAGVDPLSADARLRSVLWELLGGMGAESVENAAQRVVRERDTARIERDAARARAKAAEASCVSTRELARILQAQDEHVTAMLPSEVRLDLPVPLIGTLGRAEVEIAAALLVLACRRKDDRWGPILPKEIGEALRDALAEGEEPWRSLDGNPFLRPDFHDLVRRGHARGTLSPGSALELTEAAITALEKHRRTR